MYMHNNHCHRATAHLQLNIIIIIIIITTTTTTTITTIIISEDHNCEGHVRLPQSLVAFYFVTFKSNFGAMRRLMEGKNFNVDVKCEDPVVVKFDGSVIFVSNEHPYFDDSCLRRMHVV
jgi:hypothetical protein